MIEAGVFLMIAGLIAIVVGFVMIIVSSINKNKVLAKQGAYVLVSAGVGLLISFTLCTTGNFNI